MPLPAPRLGERTQLGTSVWGWFLVQVFVLFRAQAAVAQADETLLSLGLFRRQILKFLRR